MSDIFTIRMIEDPCLPGATVHQYPVGTSLAWAMDDLSVVFGMDADLVEVFDNERHIPRDAWHDEEPPADTVLTLKAVPGISGAVALFASFAGGWATTALGGTLLAKAVGLAVSFGIQALANSFLAPEQPSIGSDRPQQRYTISGARNRLIQWDAVPIVMGRMRVTPPYGGAPYTEPRGKNQYLRLIFVWGRGPVKLSDIRIGNTPISKFEDVEIEHDLDGTGGLSLYPRDASQQNLNANCTNQWVQRTTEPETDEIGFTVTWPNGIYEIEDDGSTGDIDFTVKAEYRAVGDTAWTRFYTFSADWERTSLQRIAGNVRPGVRGQYEVRVRASIGDGDNGRGGDAFLTAIRSFTNEAPVNSPGIAKTAVVIRASEQLNGVVDEFNAIVEREVPIWNGVDWTSRGYSNNPAALYRDILTGDSNARAVTAANVEDDNLGEWYEHCEALGLTYENYLDRQSVAGAMSAVATAGFASPTMYDDKFGVVIDRERSTVVQAITPRNSWGFSGQINSPEEVHALRVQFRNRAKDYADDEVIVYADGYSAADASLFEVVNPDGVSSVTQAQLMGRFLLLSRVLRSEPYQVSMDFEHLLARRGDLVAFSHDGALIGDTSGRIKSLAGTTLTVDEPVTFEAAGTYNARVRTKDGAMLLLDATGTGTTTDFDVSDATGITAGDLFLFGPVEGESQLCVVSDIERGDDMQANVALLPYEPQLYDAINEGVFESNLSDPVGLALVGPAQPRIIGVLSNEAALPRSATGDVQPTILVSFEPGFPPANNALVTATRNVLVSWRVSGTDDWQTEIHSAVTGEVRIPGLLAHKAYDIRLIAQDSNFRTSEAAMVNGHIITGFLAPPPPVATFRTSHNGAQAYLEWTYPTIPGDVVGYEIRYHPDQGVTTWANMTRVADIVPRAARSIMAPSTVGSYAIKPVDVTGVLSETALYVSSAISDPALTNVIVALDDAPGYHGQRDNVTILDGRLQLDGSAVVADWTAMSDVQSMLRPSGPDSPLEPMGSYTFLDPVDLLAVYTVHLDYSLRILPVSYRSFMSDWDALIEIGDLTGGVTGDEYGVEMQVRYSREDVATGFTLSDWRAFRPGDITARHIEFRVVLTTVDRSVSPALETAQVVVDVEDRVARSEDVATGAGAKAVSFSPSFAATPSITIAGQDLAAGDYHEITGKSRQGFTVTFKNNAGSAVDRTFDWQAVGYGREAGT